MRYFTIHLRDKNGNRVDYMTSEKTFTKLADKYDTVIGYLKGRGFTQVGGDKPAEATTEAQDESFCAVHKVKMTEKDGKFGKFYSHSKEIDGEWIYCNGKGFGKK